MCLLGHPDRLAMGRAKLGAEHRRHFASTPPDRSLRTPKKLINVQEEAESTSLTALTHQAFAFQSCFYPPESVCHCCGQGHPQLALATHPFLCSFSLPPSFPLPLLFCPVPLSTGLDGKWVGLSCACGVGCCSFSVIFNHVADLLFD